MSARPAVRSLPVLALALVTLQLAPGGAQAADLPRVFFSPAERAAITRDRLAGRLLARSAEPRAVPERGTARTPGASEVTAASAAAASTDVARAPTAPPAADAATASSRVARVEGVTVGRGGGRAVWIDGERIADGAHWRGFRVQVTDDGARLVAADGSVRRVRVGAEVLR